MSLRGRPAPPAPAETTKAVTISLPTVSSDEEDLEVSVIQHSEATVDPPTSTIKLATVSSEEEEAEVTLPQRRQTPEDLPELSTPSPSKLMRVESGIKVRPVDFINLNEGNLPDNYDIEKRIGEGTFGQVKIATHKPTGQKRAIKSMPKLGIPTHDSAKFIEEIEILRAIDHPNVLKLYEFYEDQYYIHLVTEICHGGDLFDYIVETDFISE